MNDIWEKEELKFLILEFVNYISWLSHSDYLIADKNLILGKKIFSIF